ncbi:MAG TPA: nucleotidyltransferase family protein [Planctomycetota bacterium]|nr:nucleotidyltransferase family protein [Planctomycetota bacterium]HRR81847.1 nucleotidyltransferase family protein [Planctomycetota bacterium]HRT93589.1 nucleotidyltransferase family protein [Planctomycetota bacterium]
MQSLHGLMPELRAKFGVTGIALFGSFARGEAGPTSDVDLVVDFDDKATLFELSGLGAFLEERLQLKVDLVPRRAIRAEIRESILREAVSV